MIARLEQLLARVPHLAWRAIGVAILSPVLWNRLSIRENYSNQLLFWLEFAIPALILISYLIRPPARSTARGAVGILLPPVAAVLPLSFITFDVTWFGLAHQEALLALLVVPTALMVWGYLSLNRSFGLLAEARELKTGGPYRWVRHPVYAAQMLCGLVVMLWRFAPANLGLYLLFVTAQVLRAGAEEAALTAAFPEYQEYARRTWRFLPGV